MLPSFENCYRAAAEKDARFDGWIYCGVTSTGIYCRPSCPARTPKAKNLQFYPSAAAAQNAGFRACKRCRPDAVPGSPEWDQRADLVGRAMRLIADGLIDREGVTGLAARLGYSERHLNRQLVESVGAGPLAIARANRAQTARTLLEMTELPITDVASAAGFASVRQFNATVREVFAETPRELRRRAKPIDSDRTGVELRLPFRKPLDLQRLFEFLAARAIPGVESGDSNGESGYTRSVALPHGPAVVALSRSDDFVRARFMLADLRDLGTAVERVRRLLDLDADPTAADAALARDPALRSSVTARPGLRVPGCVSTEELAMRAVLGQQVSVKAATTAAARISERFGDRLKSTIGSITTLFPSAATVAELDPADLPMPRKRAAALVALAGSLAEGDIRLDGGWERDEAHASLVAIPGIGSWTADYIAMRALRDPDAFLPSDLGVRRGLEAIGLASTPAEALLAAERWRPYRAYALQHLWALAADPLDPETAAIQRRTK